jgi:hypothetical protein
VTVDQLPAPDAEVWFLRAILDPGGTLPPDQQIGPTLIAVESGTVALSAERSAMVIRAGAKATPTAEQSTPGIDLLLGPGDAALVADGTTIGARNDGTVPAVMLTLLVFSPQREVLAGEGTATTEPVGVTLQPLAVGRARFPAGPGTLVIERVEVAPGASTSTGVPEGAEVGTIEQGAVRIDLASGEMWVTPPVTGGRLVEVKPGASAVIAAGDGYGLSAAVASWSAEGGGPATILRARVVPNAEGTPVA